MEETALYGFSSRAQGGAEEAEGWQQVAGNLDYTLYAFPNHGRALYAMAIYQRRMEKDDPLKIRGWLTGTRLLPADCYFQRAIGFAPDDPTVYHAYGAYLQKFGELTKATSQYEKAIELNPNAAEPRYNLGLLYFEVGDYEKASEQADRAYALGYPLPGLKNKLAAVRRAAN
jgi:Flp pilus assembly protein TadD